jgi:replication factor A1
MYNQQVPNNYMSKGAISRNEAPARIVPIKSLNPYLNRWTIQARITSKGEIRRWQNAKGEGTVFNFDVLDAEGGEIRICAFKDACEKFYPMVEVGKVYMISKGALRPARKQYNPLNSDFEIYLETSSTIEPCMEDSRTSSIPSINFNFQPIISLEQANTGSIVDVIGVVMTVGSPGTIQRRDGTETQKRSISIKDDSNAVIELTLWGNYCADPGQQLEQDNQQGAHPVVAIKSTRVGEYNGKTLGSISSTQIRVNPDIPEAGRLRHWWDKLGGAHQEAVQLNTQGGGGSDRRVCLADIRDEGLGTHGKPDYVEVLATISFIRNETLFYPACALQRAGRTCQKKLTLTSEDGWCEPCQSKSEVQWRWMVQLQASDASAQRWLAAFGDVADTIMGMKAEELKQLENTPAFDAALARATFTKWLLKVKVAEDQWQDEKRIKVNIVKAMKPDFAQESRAKIESINQLLNDVNASNKRTKHF